MGDLGVCIYSAAYHTRLLEVTEERNGPPGLRDDDDDDDDDTTQSTYDHLTD